MRSPSGCISRRALFACLAATVSACSGVPVCAAAPKFDSGMKYDQASAKFGVSCQEEM